MIINTYLSQSTRIETDYPLANPPREWDPMYNSPSSTTWGGKIVMFYEFLTGFIDPHKSILSLPLIGGKWVNFINPTIEDLFDTLGSGRMNYPRTMIQELQDLKEGQHYTDKNWIVIFQNGKYNLSERRKSKLVVDNGFKLETTASIFTAKYAGEIWKYIVREEFYQKLNLKNVQLPTSKWKIFSDAPYNVRQKEYTLDEAKALTSNLKDEIIVLEFYRHGANDEEFTRYAVFSSSGWKWGKETKSPERWEQGTFPLI